MMETPSKQWVVLFLIVLLTAAGWMLDVDDSQAKSYQARYRTYRGAKAIDGDTFFYQGKRYRIQQYNAPELGQPGADRATKLLQHKLDSGRYVWKPVAKDKYGRRIVKERLR